MSDETLKTIVQLVTALTALMAAVSSVINGRGIRRVRVINEEQNAAIHEVHLTVNGRMNDLIATTKAAATAEGIELGKLKEQAHPTIPVVPTVIVARVPEGKG